MNTDPVLIYRMIFPVLFLMIYSGCTSPSDIEGLPEMDYNTRVRFNQYYRDGRVLYLNYCGSCHMDNGEGLKNAIPSLAKSTLVGDSTDRVPCQIKYGSQNHLRAEVGPGMTGFRSLSDLEIAEITTYISSSWGNKAGLMPVKEVKGLLDRCRTSN